MDEKTEELRDLFVDVAGEDSVTERQEGSHGSLLSDEGGVGERLLSVIGSLREEFDVDTDHSDEELVTVVQRYYEGETDEEIADAIDATPTAVFRARAAVHLLRDADIDAPFDLARLRDPDADLDRIADEFDLDEPELRRYQRVVTAQTRARQVSQRFQSAFEDVLRDAGFSMMTETIRNDGLKEATEDIGSLEEDADVDF